MTDTIPTFSVTQGGNNQSTFLFPELLPPSQTTDNLRRLQAAIRRQWNQGQWFEYGRGDLSATFTFVSATQFSVINALEAVEYHVGRRVRAIGSLVGTITGSITNVSQTGGNTNVTVNWDTGGLSNENFIIQLAIISAVNSSLPRNTEVGQAFNGDNDFDGSVTISENLDVSGDITGDNATFDTVNFNSGPFNLLGQERRVSTQGSIVVPDGTKQMIIEMYGAGGGGSTGDDVLGSAGSTAVLTSNPPGRSLTLPGGARGGTGGNGTIGQNQASGSGLVVEGAFLSTADAPGLGSPGGAGAKRGISGNPGGYVKAIVNATDDQITSWLMTGGGGGAGGNGSPDGGNGGRAIVIITFYG